MDMDMDHEKNFNIYLKALARLNPDQLSEVVEIIAASYEYYREPELPDYFLDVFNQMIEEDTND